MTPSATLRARVTRPLRRFMTAEVSGGIVLLAATVLALVWANSPLGDTYRELWATPVRIGTDAIGLGKPLVLWINDGLMAIFFLVVGLEIKRELRRGELASARRAAVPIAAAVGGAVTPALIYLAFTAGSEAARGWGVAMATDIAFALGVLAVLGRRVPVALKVFVTAVAIVDDILAVLVIALFYSGSLAIGWLLGAAVLVAVLLMLNRQGVRRLAPYLVVGVVLWVAVLQSGVHATLAGVVLATTIPLGRADATGEHGSPLHRLEHALHPWTAFAIVPIFALANAGVAIGGSVAEAIGSPVSAGIVAGLVLGKQVGILGATWVLVRIGAAALPAGLTWRHVWGAGWVCGIGFTMSLFIGELAFAGSTTLDVAKISILVASVISAIGGVLVLSRTDR